MTASDGPPGKPIVVATHQRSGTHVIIDTLRRQFAECDIRKWPGQRLDRVYVTLGGSLRNKHGNTLATAERVLRRCRRPVCKSHDLPGFRPDDEQAATWYQELLDRSDVIYGYRDPREVLLSHWVFNRHKGHDRTVAEFLREEMYGFKSRIDFWRHHVESWLARPGVIPLDYNRFVRAPREPIEQLSKQLEMQPRWREPLLPPRRRWGLAAGWARLATRPQSTAIMLGYIRNRPPKWQQVLTPDDRRLFHEHAGKLMIRLGYVESDAWVDG